MTIWNQPPSIDVPPALADAVGGHPLVAQLLARRGIIEPDQARMFLDPEAYTPAPPTALPDVDVAVERLLRARDAGTRVCVWGDFDVDGQSSTALLVAGLRELDFDVCYYVPRRDRDGHGLHEAGIRQVITQDGAGLIMTCDTGVSDVDAVATANQLGAEVIITDHHELPETLPAAVAIVNPHRLAGENHPLRHLCGVGTAYMLLSALYGEVGRGKAVEQWLDLVALGTIADLAILRDDNRYLVQRGLPKLVYQPRAGIRALLQTAGRSPGELLDTEIVSFTLAPRLNAVGRLDDARTAVELLLTNDISHAFDLATELEILNDQRKRLCDEIEADIERRLRDRPELLEAPALMLAGEDWHPGVIGIVASRLVERYNKPAILLSGVRDGELRASARSIPGLHLQDAISEHEEMLLRGGGHEMAAGFVTEPAQFAQFRDALQATVAEAIPENVAPELNIDATVALPDITPDFVRQIYRLAPFGPGNPEPVFACPTVRLRNISALGVNGDHARLAVEDADNVTRPAIWWRTMPHDVPTGALDVAFNVELNEYGSGPPTARLVIVGTRSQPRRQEAVQAPQVEYEPAQTVRTRSIVDQRGYEDRLHYLREVFDQPDIERIQVWAEGPAAREVVHAVDRTQLIPGTDLVLWSIPAGPRLLHTILDRVMPQRVYLLTPASVESLSVNAFLRTLANTVKGIIDRSDETSIVALAIQFGHREETVRYGLSFLQARGYIRYEVDSGRLVIRNGNGAPTSSDDIEQILIRLLQETSAYRRYFATADAEMVLRFID